MNQSQSQSWIEWIGSVASNRRTYRPLTATAKDRRAAFDVSAAAEVSCENLLVRCDLTRSCLHRVSASAAVALEPRARRLVGKAARRSSSASSQILGHLPVFSAQPAPPLASSPCCSAIPHQLWQPCQVLAEPECTMCTWLFFWRVNK